jgi:hypothetical protein
MGYGISDTGYGPDDLEVLVDALIVATSGPVEVT